MSRNKAVSFQYDTLIDVTCSVTPFRRGKGPSMDHSGGEQEEPSEVEDLCVLLNIIGGEAPLDITDMLTKEQVKFFETQCFENATDGE